MNTKIVKTIKNMYVLHKSKIHFKQDPSTKPPIYGHINIIISIVLVVLVVPVFRSSSGIS